MFELVPGVKRRRSRRRDPSAASADRAFETVRGEILHRDRMTCQACGFASVGSRERPSGGLEVHHIDDDHTNNRKENLITLCPFCHMVFTLGRRGAVFVADIIWFPDIEQRTINRLAHEVAFLLWVRQSLLRGDEEVRIWLEGEEQVFDRVFDRAVERWRMLQTMGRSRLYSVFPDEQIGFTKPDLLYMLLVSCPAQEYEQRRSVLGGVRLLPKIDHESFSGLIDYWSRAVWIQKGRASQWKQFLGEAPADNTCEAQ